MPCTASATEEVVSSMIESTCSVSYHWRAMFEAMSALFWWSAVTTSIGAPSTVPPIILDRHLRRLEGPLAAEVGIDAGLVVQDADLDLVVGYLRDGGQRRCRAEDRREKR